MTQNVGKLYKSVIEDVVTSVREAFVDDGVDEQVLMDLKSMWERRLQESRAVDTRVESESGPSVPQPNSRGGGRAAANRSEPPAHPVPIQSTFQPVAGASSRGTGGPWDSRTGAPLVQLDGPNDSSDDEPDDDDFRDRDDDDHEDNDDEANDEENDDPGEDEEPLNSEDDVSDEEPNELFETDNVVVCQYDKVTRSRNKWKFHLKDGVMNIQGKDYVFQKAVGDAEW